VPAGPEATTLTEADIPIVLTWNLPTGVLTLVPVVVPVTLWVVPEELPVAVMRRLPEGDQPELLPANLMS
jgi:hypothetical protein